MSMTKLKAREDELKANNFPHADGQLVNIANIVNPFQLTTFDERLQKALSRQGFAIVPGENDQLFHVYERNDYHNFPNFVTTDLFLQAFHMYFDCLLRDVEEQRLLPVMTDFSKTVHQEMSNIALQTKNPELPVIQQVVRNDFEQFSRELLEERQLFHYPPYYRLIYVYLKHSKDDVVNTAGIELGSRLRQWFGDRVLGPDKPAVARVKTLSIRKLVIKLENGIDMPRVRQYLLLAQQQMLQDKRYGSLQIYYDVDPL